jgi:cytochrome b subunit of formate dehydrogenase
MHLLHASLAVAVFALLASGLALQEPALRGIPFLGSRLVREVHLTWALLLVIGPALAASWDGFREPVAVWLSDRFNLGQRLNVVLVLVLLVGLGLSGLVVAMDRLVVPQVVRETAYGVHRLLAYAMLALVAAHVAVALGRLYTGRTKSHSGGP